MPAMEDGQSTFAGVGWTRFINILPDRNPTGSGVIGPADSVTDHDHGFE